MDVKYTVMRTAREIVVLFIILLLTASASPGASWEDISRTATTNDELVSAGKQLESARWSYNRAWSGFLPQVSLSGSYSENLADGADAATKSYSVGVNATQYIFKGLQNYYGLMSAYSNYQHTLANYKSIESNVYYNLRVAFFDLYIAQENLDLLNKILSQLKENARLIKLRYDSGREDRGNMLATVASERDGEATVSAAKRQLDLAKLRLFQLSSMEVEKVDGDANVTYEANPDFASLAESSPSYAMARYQLEMTDIAAKNSIGEFLPTLSLSGNYSRKGPDWPPDTSNKSWGLNLSYPLFPGGANFADKIINDLNLEKARRDFESSRKDILYNIEDAYRAVRDAADDLDVRRIYLEAAEERARIANAKYLNGLVTYDEWNRITNDHISAQKNLVSSKRSVMQAIAAFKNSYGGH
jgi:outer membrane protein TolC